MTDPYVTRAGAGEYSAKTAISAILTRLPVLERHSCLGIKGQYLLLDTGVINIRKYTAYTLSCQCA